MTNETQEKYRRPEPKNTGETVAQYFKRLTGEECPPYPKWEVMKGDLFEKVSEGVSWLAKTMFDVEKLKWNLEYGGVMCRFLEIRDRFRELEAKVAALEAERGKEGKTP